MSNKEIKEHQLFITSLRLWLKLRGQNKISKSKKAMANKITFFVLASLPFRWIQSLYVPFKLRSVSLKEKPPVFVIGHWRSGTTHLHYLLAQDDQFSYLEAFQAFFFKVAFVSKSFMRPVLNYFMPSTRPQDNIKIDASAPTEEEHPLTNLTEKSGMQTFFFPRNRKYFDKFNLFENTKKNEINSWKKIYHKMLCQIALYQGKDKQLLLKNPHNTGRIKVLLELYPNAKFIFIHRNPYDVFLSNVHLYNSTIKTQFLQEFNQDEVEKRVIYCYEKTMKKYIEERALIDPKNHVEISYKELADEPIKTIRKIYDKIELGEFSKVESKIQDYLKSLGEYKTNQFKKPEKELINTINERWEFSFKEWGYKMLNQSEPELKK